MVLKMTEKYVLGSPASGAVSMPSSSRRCSATWPTGSFQALLFGGLGLRVLGFFGVLRVLGFWGFGVEGFRVLGFFGVLRALGFWGLRVLGL